MIYLHYFIQNLIEYIPVRVRTPAVGLVPRRIRLLIGYSQVSDTQKELLRASIEFLDVDNDFGSRDYLLDISYLPLQYFDVLDTFTFDDPIYVIVYTLISGFLIVLVSIIWILLYAAHFFKNRVCPGFNLTGYIKHATFPLLQGLSLSLIPISVISIIMISLFRNGQFLIERSADYELDEGEEEDEELYVLYFSILQIVFRILSGNIFLSLVYLSLPFLHTSEKRAI